MQQLLELVTAGMCFAAAVACSAASWRALLGGGLSLPSACARYGVGSLVNTALPGRAGDAIRVGLFGRVTAGGVLPVAGAVAGVGALRWAALLPLGAAGAIGAHASPLALGGLVLAVAPVPGLWLLARSGSKRARATLAPLRAARTSTYLIVLAWVAGTLVARSAAVAIACGALGVAHPLTTALLVVPALEIAGIVPLTPANIGVAGSAAAMALHAHGTPLHTALAAGFALHGVETCAGAAFGAASTLALARTTSWRTLVTLRPLVAGPTQL
jgi:hypothetical protein